MKESVKREEKLVEEKYAWAKGVEVLEGILEDMIKIPPKPQVL